MINARLWEILVAFYQCGTLSAAAEKLYVSQPALSSAMKQLEKELGVTLFERTKNRITLNEIGVEAARFAQEHISQEESLIQYLREMQRRLQTITVASFVSGLRNDLVNQLSIMFPERSIASEHVSSEQLQLGLLNGCFSFVITEYEIDEPDIVCVPYVTDRLMVRIHSGDQLFDREFLSLDDLRSSALLVWEGSGFWASFIRKEFLNVLQLIFINSEQEYWELVSHFPMRSFILETALEKHPFSPEYRCIPFEDDRTRVSFYLCCHQKNAGHLPNLQYRRKGTRLPGPAKAISG